jgi:hypothetical protein
MTWILDEAEVVLRKDRFSTIRLPDNSAFVFEDETVFGFVVEYSTAKDLLNNWQPNQDKLLERFSAILRNAGAKAWNVYTVLLTEGMTDDAQQTHIFETIEENLRHTRKIPRQNIRTPSDVRAALAPLLAVPTQSILAAESFEVRLTRKLEAEIGAEAAKSFLGEADEETVARLLAEKSQ